MAAGHGTDNNSCKQNHDRRSIKPGQLLHVRKIMIAELHHDIYHVRYFHLYRFHISNNYTFTGELASH